MSNRNDNNNGYNSYNDGYNSYNGGYNDYNGGYNDYNGYNDNNYNGYDNNDDNNNKKKPKFGVFFAIIIVLLLIGAIGVYSVKTISNQIKPSKDNNIVQVFEDDEEEGENQEGGEEQDQETETKVEEEEVEKEDPTKDMTKEELAAYEKEQESTVVIGGEVLSSSNAAEIQKVKESSFNNVEYILGQYFNGLKIGSHDISGEISKVSKGAKQRLSDFDVSITTKEQDSQISFVVKVDEVSFNKTYKLDIIEVKNVVEALTPEERAKEEESIKKLNGN